MSVPDFDTVGYQSDRPPSWLPGTGKLCTRPGHNTVCNPLSPDASHSVLHNSQQHLQNLAFESSRNREGTMLLWTEIIESIIECSQ